MGMYDSVMTKCPDCGTSVEFQSKAGTCNCCEYDVHEVPVEIAKDLENMTETCQQCGRILRLKLFFPLTTVPMRVE